MDDIAALIRARLPLVPVPMIPAIRLHMAQSREALAVFPAEPPPYWAYVWAGGAAVARHILANPALVRGHAVLDLGAGSGIVGIAAGLSGARGVVAAEIDPVAGLAIGLNAEANLTAVEVVPADLLDGPAPPGIDVVLVGDMLYDRELAARIEPFLFRCRAAGIDVIIGDPGRGLLPSARKLVHLGSYGEASIEDDPDGPTTPAGVYAII